MIHISMGQAEGLDAADTVDQVIEACRLQLGGRRPSAGLLFAGAGFDHQVILDGVARAFPGLALIGCTTAGNFSSTGGFSDDAVSLMVFSSDTIEIRVGLGRRLSRGYRSAARDALAMANDGRTLPTRICLILPDLVNHAGGDIIAALQRELDEDCGIFGGSPAALDFTGQTIHQFFGREVLEDALPLMLFCGPVDYRYFVANSWKSIGPRETVTGSDGRRVRRIGQRRALDFYFHYLGRHDDPATEFPLAVYPDNGPHFSLRAPMYYHPEDGAITFAEAVPEGATVQLTEAYRDHLVRDIGTSARDLEEGPRPFQPFAALAFSCSLRKQALGTRIVEEIEALRQLNQAGLPIMGFYGYGEIAPPARDGESICHNATLVTLVLGAGQGAGGVAAAARAAPKTPASLEALSSITETFETLKKENAFLRRRLARSETYRRRLEDIKELNAGLHRQIIQEIEEARREIAQREKESVKALRLAGEVQKNLLPRGHLSVGGLEVAGRNLPGQAIGGDYFDYLQHDPDCGTCLSAVVGDISGHGVDAALLMTSARGFLRTRVGQPGSAADIVTDMNRYLAADVLDSGRFMTLFFLTIDPHARRLRWVRAGHDPALVYQPSRDGFDELMGEGLALGVDPRGTYAENVFAGLEEGQIIVVATDGIFEARDGRGDMFGHARLREVIRRSRTEAAPGIVANVFEAVGRHTRNRPPEDDRTLLVVKIVKL
jgi:sigma-B regulation protein RsbU (phosphoserine phosphatase)